MLNLTQTQDLSALLPGQSTEAGATRRTALKAALGVGYAASTLPTLAQTAIKTSADGLTVGEVTIDVNGFGMRPTGPRRRARPVCRWCWCFPRSSVFTSTSPTPPGALREPVTWPSRRNFLSGREMRKATAKWPG